MSDPMREARIRPQETMEIITKLRRFHFRDKDFELFHHWGTKGKLKRFLSYCNEDKNREFQIDGNNHRLHWRLVYALSCCQNGELDRGKSFAHLAREAFDKLPPV